MMNEGGNVLSKRTRWTQSFVSSLIANAVRGVQAQQGLTDQDLADMIGCSAGTIKNARNGAGQLQPYALFLLLEVSPTALEGLLHHFDRRSVPLGAKCDTDAMPSTAAVMHKLAVASTDGRISDRECLEMEATLDAAIEALSGIKSRCLSIREQRA